MTEISTDGTRYEIEVEFIQFEPTFNPYSEFRGWMSPNGEMHPLYGVDGHSKLAKEILKYNGDDPIEALHDAGWIRVACENSYSCKKLDENTRRLLLKMVLERHHCVKFFIDIGTESLQLLRDDAVEYLKTPTLE